LAASMEVVSAWPDRCGCWYLGSSLVSASTVDRLQSATDKCCTEIGYGNAYQISAARYPQC
ncbi:hypothetical protein BGZ73_000918, partial [Actinomortierella ambigua]